MTSGVFRILRRGKCQRHEVRGTEGTMGKGSVLGGGVPSHQRGVWARCYAPPQIVLIFGSKWAVFVRIFSCSGKFWGIRQYCLNIPLPLIQEM